MASTFVYVSNAADGDLSTYRLESATASLRAGPRAQAAAIVMPLAATPDGRYLYAASRAEPYRVFSYSVDPQTGQLAAIGETALADSMVSMAVDRSGQWLIAASYGGNSLSVHAIESDGRIADESAYFAPSGADKPHAIHVDPDNQTVYVPHLGSDVILSYRFDAATGVLTADPQAQLSVAAGTGPRHIVGSRDRRFLYVLGEFRGTVDVFERDASHGRFGHIQSEFTLPRDTSLVPGAPRAPSGTTETAGFDLSTAIFCADIHLSPDGNFLYTSERTGSTLSRLSVDRVSGHVRFIDSIETEAQPRGFAIDPKGQFMIVSGQRSRTISLYTIDAASGAMTLAAKAEVGQDANWVQLISID